MAFIILSDSVEEVDRRPLRKAMTVGRSAECDVAVRDHLLSRQHCRIEPHGQRWVLIDLDSKNGTRFGEERITRRVLEDGDVIGIGRSTISYREGAFIPAPVQAGPRRVRPLDPWEAMAATVAGIEFVPQGIEAMTAKRPEPQPKPPDPKAYEKDGIGQLVATMAASAWEKKAAKTIPAARESRSLPQPARGEWIIPDPQEPAEAPVVQKPVDFAFIKPARWVVTSYLALAGSVFATCIATILWTSLQ